ncbi:MAG: hypothetical protein DI563_02920 [Variovorax paradoxus]|uniref:ParB-like N-terminal domain-containing protein n=1 Tax=Variovorax paradoxus TaxID=34073 RepID=A0A2W5QGQ7_VARPD|nr:MAG: hypothetical protein DI563_02920 [Variovorax paradoxus]
MLRPFNPTTERNGNDRNRYPLVCVPQDLARRQWRRQQGPDLRDRAQGVQVQEDAGGRQGEQCRCRRERSIDPGGDRPARPVRAAGKAGAERGQRASGVQLQRLAVVAHAENSYAVVAGGRRLRAMQRLVAQGKWAADHPVECKLYESERAAEVSLAENSGREAMHPADEMEAFRGLVEQGFTVAQVAGRFGVTVLTVEKRLKLSRLAPRFLAMYRADEIDPDQMQALALTEDPTVQEAVWDGLPTYDRDAWSIRRALTEEACRGDSRLARFVGIDAYEARGGAVRRDLFAEDRHGEAAGVGRESARRGLGVGGLPHRGRPPGLAQLRTRAARRA